MIFFVSKVKSKWNWFASENDDFAIENGVNIQWYIASGI